VIGPPLTDDTILSLHRLHVGDASGQDGDAEVGRPDTGVFVGLPPMGVELVRLLSAGLNLGEVKRNFADRYGEAPDLPPFLEAIVSCGFVQAIDGHPVTAPDAPDDAPWGWRLLEHLPERSVAWLLSRPMRVLYALVWLAVPALLLLRPELLPSASRAWITPRIMVNFTALALLGWALVFFHELAHLVALRARGCVGALRLRRA
jgi:putative peptide zinc metalloprotease protein